MGQMSQLTTGSSGSRVTTFDPLLALTNALYTLSRTNAFLTGRLSEYRRCNQS